MTAATRAGVATAVCLGWWLRLRGFLGNTFQADEALFATWARHIAVWRDPLLITQALDKPPLLFYLQALFYPLVGPELWAARLPNLIAGTVLLPATAVLAWHWGRGETAVVLTAFLVALSPLLIQFTGSAYTDPLLVTLLLLALLAAARQRPGWSGLWLGLALWAKYQALVFAPLLVFVGWQQAWGRRQWQRMALAFLSLALLLPLWDLVRSGGFSLWQAQMVSYGGVRPAWSWELWPRLLAWGHLLATAVGAAWRLAPLLLVIIFGWLTARGEKETVWPVWLLLFAAAYLAVHWLLAVPVWDRYLLPIWPLLLLVVALGLARFLVVLRPHALQMALVLLFIIFLLPPGLAAREGRFGLGSTPAADDGAGRVAALLAEAPYGTVLYDHWYSWQWRYYFFDHTVYVSWVPGPAALQADLAAFGQQGPARYLALPADRRALPMKTAVAEAGYQLLPVAPATSDAMTLYQLAPVEPLP